MDHLINGNGNGNGNGHGATSGPKSIEDGDGGDGGNAREMIDITSTVESCVGSLEFTNPMVCTVSFCLQDSMAAMELLDSKMDSCEIPAQQIQVQPMNGTAIETDVKILYPRPTPTGIDDGFLPLPWDDLTLRDSCLIAGEALVRLESMLGGSSVVESIYTCLYAHSDVCEDMKARIAGDKESSATVPQHVVCATSLALVEISEIMRSIVLQGDIYEEEDFCANTYNVQIYSNREKGSTMSELSHALQLVEGDGAAESDEGIAVVCILGFLMDLLTLTSSLARVAGAKVIQTMMETKERVGLATQKIDKVATIWKRITEQKSTRDTHILQRTFDAFVNRPLCGNAPVRKVVFLEPAQSFSLLSRIVAEIDWALCEVILKGTSIRRIRRILDRLSKSSINILARSLLVLNLYFDEKLLGQFSLSEFIITQMQEMAAVPSEMFETKYGRLFLNRLAKPIYDTLKLRLLNRNRQRAFMEAVIIPDWSRLQQEAHVIDVRYRKEKGLGNESPPYISHFVLANLVDLMDTHVSIGVELSLFRSQEDLAAVFWYRDFLLSTMLNVMSAMQKTKDAVAPKGSGSSKRGTAKSTNDKKKGKDGSSQSKEQETLENEFDLVVWESKRSLCRGLVRFIAGLEKAGFSEKKTFRFTTSENVFQKRFEAFAEIQQPPPLSYADFLQGSSFSKVSQSDLLASAGECFKASKTGVGKLLSVLSSVDATSLSMTKEDLNQMAKVGVGNSVYLQKFGQAVTSQDKNRQQKVSYDFDPNSEFCTIKVD